MTRADALGELTGGVHKTGRRWLSVKVGNAVDETLRHHMPALAHRRSVRLDPIPEHGWIRAEQAFSAAMDHLAAPLAQLLVEAQPSLTNLDALKQRLTTLHEFLVRSDTAARVCRGAVGI